MTPPADSDTEVEERAPGPVPPAAPGLAGVVAFPGLAVWRRWPVAGSLLFSAGVIAPCFALILVLQHRDDPVGLFTRPNVLRGLVLVALAAITTRIVAVWLTADRVRDPQTQRHFRIVGSAVVAGLALPTVLLVVRMEEARAVVKEVFQESADAGAVSVGPDVDPLAGEFHTVLLMGSDEGADRVGLRTDTMILALVDQASGRAALVSIPRNLTHLQFPAGSLLADRYPNGYKDDEGGFINALYNTVDNDEALTAAYGKGSNEAGVQALMEGLSFSLGITIDDYALINSCGFVRVVDAIGGITIDIDRELPMPSKLKCSNYRLTPTIGPGETFMDGTKALGYVRSRLGDSDYQRMDRQRLLLQTIADEVGIDDLLLRFGELAAAVADNVRTSMTVEEARTLLATLQSTDQQFESVGLAPPLVEPHDPDYVAVKALLQQVRQALHDGTVLDLPTDTTG
ncbi:MAG: LCP family protein [Ilumatobacteraceae bacterium]|jgi:LCP family protein required for cell wall assembly|nr:LCP family protein [Acidimicrobiaceae bacterium]MBP6488739.1 LCP family protein [Ilumatobacteraceae bacterium]MBP7890053.1 LCP family protein [Ilumatobacteraceae bacterium]MBP8210360.1 LCP family protein [Ilumatobacteraceae bacterium]MBP9053105.1 LCP family protein [Ilumatobacteraceae bacterium]